jgi:hypothetical protein
MVCYSGTTIKTSTNCAEGEILAAFTGSADLKQSMKFLSK